MSVPPLSAAEPSVLVVISHYNAWETDRLSALLDQVAAIPAGHPHRVRIVVNQAVPRPLELPAAHAETEVLYRENTGYNIGAWEYGWRTDPPYDAYLFLQEECRIARPNWLAAYLEQLRKTGIGLLGEQTGWDSTWKYLKDYSGPYCQSWTNLEDGRCVDLATYYLDFLERRGIPSGTRGDHLQSLVLCTTRAVLEAVDGFMLGRDYREAVASEIAMSKKVQALGLKSKQIGLLPFTYVEHAQWADSGRWNLPPLKRYRKLAAARLRSMMPEFLQERLDYLMMATGKAYRPPQARLAQPGRETAPRENSGPGTA